MPTINVGPGSDLELQEIADTLGKSRKVIVVTGAGISTNCGIPDFRSENGLYSLIQAQYDAALQNPPWENTDDFEIDDRPKKKRRVTDRWYYEIVPRTGAAMQNTHISSTEDTESGSPRPQSASRATTSRSTPAARRSPDSSPLSSPRSISPPCPNFLSIQDAAILPPQPPGTTTAALSRSLSSTSNSSRSSSVFTTDGISKEVLSQSDSSAPSCSAKVDSTASTINTQERFASSPPSSTDIDTSQDEPQLSQPPGSRALPNLKGRDLFDSMVWSDPFTTSIFYMFITSLRQKIRNVRHTTSTHRLIRTLRDGGRLVRNYTQNIDSLEEREGLCTEIALGPGSRTRFQSKILREPRPATVERGSPLCGGVECVLLHGSLVNLRCGICGTLCSWETESRETTTLSGSAPDCPSCAESSARRRGRGRRALAVGRLRPDIVLYGEEHPNATLIAPLITHDLALGPDFLLIMGTSLKVHGLKVMVKEFAKSVRSKGGKVVFVNRTKPPESTWGEFIDYWVEWDCDEWVEDLQERREDIWLPQGSQMEPDRRNLAGNTKMEKMSKGPRAQSSRPQAIRDDKLSGVYHTFKILDSLRLLADSSGAISNRRIYWEKTPRIAIAPPRSEPAKQPRKPLPTSKDTTKGPSRKRKSCPSTLPTQRTKDSATEIWDRLRKVAPGLNSTPPELGRVPLKTLHYNRDIPVHKLFMNYSRSFVDQSPNRFPWLNGLTLATHPPSGAGPPLHPPERVEKPASKQAIIETRPITHAYGTRASARISGTVGESAVPAPLTQTSTPSTMITAANNLSHPRLVSEASVKTYTTTDGASTNATLLPETTNHTPIIGVDGTAFISSYSTSSNSPQSATSVVDDTHGHRSFIPEISNRSATIAVDDSLSSPHLPLMSSQDAVIVVNDASRSSRPTPLTTDTIVVTIPSHEDEKPATPPASGQMTPTSQRIKRMGSIGAILSSPEDGSRSNESVRTVYYDAEEI